MDERRTNVGYLGCLSQVAGMLLPLLACLVAAAVHDSGHPTAAIVWATLLILSGLALFFYGSGKVREATLLAKSREVAENAADPPADPDQQGTEAEPIGLEQDPLDVAARAVARGRADLAPSAAPGARPRPDRGLPGLCRVSMGPSSVRPAIAARKADAVPDAASERPILDLA